MCASMSVLMARCSEDICSFLTLQLNDARQFQIHTRYLDALLGLASLVLNQTSNGQVHMTIMEAMFSPAGALYKLRCNKSLQVQASFVRVSRDILALKDVPLVQAAFEHLANDLRSSNPKIALAAVRALQGMAETKNSLIPLLALRPSLFELVYSLVGDPAVDERVQPELLRLLRIHSVTHGHFVLTSDLIEPSTSTTANYLNMILQLLTKQLPYGGYISISVLDWLEELISNPVLFSCGHLATTPAMTALVAAIVDVIIKQWKNPDSERALAILINLLKLEGWTFGESTLAEARKLTKLGSMDKQILAALEIAGEAGEELIERRDWQAGDPTAFKKFMLYVSGKSDKLTDILLSRLYMKCEGDGSSSVPCSGVLWDWLACQSAQHLVHGRLKSYLGKPLDSLGFIEGVLKSSLDEHRGSVMLKFMDALERCMYQAYEGTVTVSNSYDKACRAFFRANRNTCQEWLQRVRPFVAKLTITRGQYPLAVWQLESFFDNRLTLNADQISFFASLYTKAVIELKAPNRLLGFAHFLSANFTLSESLSQWLKASSQHAGQKLETALRSYEKLKLKDSPILTEMVKDQMENCRKSLRISEDLTQWDEPRLKDFVSRQRKKLNINLSFNALRNFESSTDETLVLTEMTPEARAAYRFSSSLCNRLYSKLVRTLDGPSAAVAVLSEGRAGDAESLVDLARVLAAGGVGAARDGSPGVASEGQHQWRVGLLLREACQQKPDYAKAFFKFADWSYHCGKRDMDSGDTQISAVEQKLISSILSPLGVAHLATPMCSVIGRIEYCDSGNCGCTSKKQKIVALLDAENVSETALSLARDQLLSVELAVQARVFGHYHAALDAYFHFLRLSPAGSDAAQAEATLRLLRLIVKHAHSLQETLESHMTNNIVTEPWHAIIPQLFARLNHPEEYVRRTLVRLIASIGESGALRLVAYPAIVGEQAAHQEDRLANIRRLQQDPSQELSQSMAESSEEEGFVVRKTNGETAKHMLEA
ncbi:serine/threonine-protein kinase SMG1-like [Tropilaelaps mercedesae]|uniref:Serine/threonine-protein kinase SMG1-like n=1 Tax=Tropilaelaps mercedesae TaxID=418985 RepID=A0A1V9X3K4_9ACAR|nr:serine/threonine-protein kinase SMG1-like [Tropilaelaps mercedesae]